jgi:hypothetical protein
MNRDSHTYHGGMFDPLTILEGQKYRYSETHGRYPRPLDPNRVKERWEMMLADHVKEIEAETARIKAKYAKEAK